MPSLDTLVPDIQGVLDPDNHHIVSEANLEAFAANLKDVMRDFFQVRERKGALRFSAIGKQPRQLWYRQHEPEYAESMPPAALMKFLYGHVIEALLLFLAREAGHDVSCEQEQVEIDGVKGHMDAVIDGHVIDVKSASPFAFKKFAEGELQPQDDAFGYIRQLAGYATAKDLPAAFLVADKVSGKIALSPLSSYTIEGHPPAPRIEMLKQVLAEPVPPPRCYPDEPEGKSGNRKLGVGCSYCEFKWRCYPNLRGFAYSTGPKYLTHVAREPDVPEIFPK